MFCGATIVLQSCTREMGPSAHWFTDKTVESFLPTAPSGLTANPVQIVRKYSADTCPVNRQKHEFS